MADGDGIERPDWWFYPTACRNGHPWAPGRITVNWHPCECPAAQRNLWGHLRVSCRTEGCGSVWYTPKHDTESEASDSVFRAVASKHLLSF